MLEPVIVHCSRENEKNISNKMVGCPVLKYAMCMCQVEIKICCFQRFWTLVIGCMVSPGIIQAVQLGSDQTFPFYCSIGEPVILMDGKELIIIPAKDELSTTRIGIVPNSKMNTFPHQMAID